MNTLHGFMRKTLFAAGLLLLSQGCSRQLSSPNDPLTMIQIQDRNGFTETISAPERLIHYEAADFLGSQPYKKVMRVYKKDGKHHSILTTYHPNGSIAQYLEAKEMRAYGTYREWFSNGQLKIEAHVIGGTADTAQGAQKDWIFEGTSRVWDEEGHLSAQIPYQGGMLHGTSLYFYPCGTPKCKIPYAKNMEEGDRLEYYPNGALKSKTRYARGVAAGPSIGFFETNQKAWEEEFREGLLLKGEYYNCEGEQIAAVEDGRGMQARYDGSGVAFLLEVRQGSPEGVVQKFHKNGELAALYSLKGGKKHGEELAYYPSEKKDREPKPKLSIYWDQGSVHGIVKTWYPNGQLQSQREYCRNIKSGPSCAWYHNGSLMFVEEYEEGSLIKGAYYKKNQNEPASTVLNGTGTALLYDENGIFSKKILYSKGKPVDPEE